MEAQPCRAVRHRLTQVAGVAGQTVRVNRRLALVAVWALFAAAAVGVGFGAAGLVGDPFTDGEVGSATAAGSPSSVTPAPASSSPTGSSAEATPDGTGTTKVSTPDDRQREVTRSVTTRGGFVSGTCRGGLVRLSAAPEVGWAIDDLDSGARAEARVRFERADDGDGRVEVRARCSGGVPRFEVRDDSSGHGSGD